MKRLFSKKGFMILIVLIINPQYVEAAKRTTRTRAVTGAQFLEIGLGGRAVGMGEAFTAISDDVYALHYNPAGLADLKRPTISGQHTEFFAGINHEFLGVAIPYSNRVTIGMSGLLSSAKDTNRPAVGVELGSFKIQDFALSFGGAYEVSRRLRFGGVLRILNQRLAEEVINSYSFDIGVKFRPYAKHLELGLALQNLGPSIKFIEERDPLPRRFKLGAVYKMLDERLQVDADVNITRDEETSGGIGSEFNFRDFIYLRAGYRYGVEFKGLDAINAGVGLRFRDMQVDYAFANFGELGGTHRVSGTLDFGRTREEKTRSIAHKKEVKQKPKIVKKEAIKPQTRVYSIYIVSFLPTEPEMEFYGETIMKTLYNKCKENEHIKLITEKEVLDSAQEKGYETTDFISIMNNLKLDFIMIGEYSTSDDNIHIESTLIRNDGEVYFPYSDGTGLARVIQGLYEMLRKQINNQ